MNVASRRVSVAPVSVRPSVAVRFQDSSKTQSIDKVITEEHNVVRGLFKEIQSASGDRKQQLAYNIIRELSMHASKEEEILYPTISQKFGKEAANHLLKEHKALKELLSDLAGSDPDSPQFDKILAQVKSEFDQHTKEEEERELPKLVKAEGVDPEGLAREFLKAGEHAVTRPHTWAPDKAPLNWFTNRLTAPLDNAADAIQGRK